MHIRLSTASDYNAIATVTVKAHVSDVRIAHLYPGRDAHPEAYHRYHVKDIDNYALEPQNFVVVAETEPSDPGWTGETQIAGYSCWSRACKSAATRQRWRAKESLGQKFLRRARTSTLAYYATMLNNPAVSAVRDWKFGRNADDKLDDPAYKDPDEAWDLDFLAAAPEFQRRGVGMLLLQWGLRHASEEGVPVTVTSTAAGRRLYEKAGFVRYGTWAWGKGEETVLLLMRWDPPAGNG